MSMVSEGTGSPGSPARCTRTMPSSVFGAESSESSCSAADITAAIDGSSAAAASVEAVSPADAVSAAAAVSSSEALPAAGAVSAVSGKKGF